MNRKKAACQIKALIDAPTGKLAIQILASFTIYGNLAGIKNTVIYGGVEARCTNRSLA